MRIVESLPQPVMEIEHLWIPMSTSSGLLDVCGGRLPPDDEPLPGVLEMIPYRNAT
jgi:hypothetical protein